MVVPGGIPGVAVAAVVIITRSLSARADIGLGEGILERCRVWVSVRSRERIGSDFNSTGEF